MLNIQTNKNMKNFKVNFYKNNDWDCTDIISSVNIECKSIATAERMLINFFPKEFGSYKLYDNGNCRIFTSKENHIKFQLERYKNNK